MCNVCLLLDKTWPTPKELARAVGEVLPTEEHLDLLERKIIDRADYHTNDPYKYYKEFKEELIKDTFKLED